MPRYEDEDRTYHGIPIKLRERDDYDWQSARIQVEPTKFGPTERQDVQALRVFNETDEDSGFGWGYDGTGTSRAAAVILADALNVDPDKFSLDAYPQDDADIDLREDFCKDVLSQMCEEFRLRRGAVLRWVRGWYSQRQFDELPAAVAELPPIGRW